MPGQLPTEKVNRCMITFSVQTVALSDQAIISNYNACSSFLTSPVIPLQEQQAGGKHTRQALSI